MSRWPSSPTATRSPCPSGGHPVYRTPAWIIALVQLVRLLAWLVRLIARHPLAATVVAVLVLAWLNVGWLGLVLLAAWAVVVLAAWRFFWPSSFTRWIAGPARGRWRGWWCYRRRWAGVMAISGVAPWHQGRIILPVLGKVASTRYTDRVAVRLVSGQSPADLAKCAENLAHGFGAMLCRVRTARSGRVVLEFVRRDALAAIVPALPIPAHPDLTALPVGRREDGLPWLVRLHGTHLLIAGATGAGKASLLWVADPGHVPADAGRAGPGAGRRSQADGAGVRPDHLRDLRAVRRRPGSHRGHAGASRGGHAGPGGPVRREAPRSHPDRG